jgi:hypothetical protein
MLLDTSLWTRSQLVVDSRKHVILRLELLIKKDNWTLAISKYAVGVWVGNNM